MKKETYLGAGLMLLSSMAFAGGADSTAAKSPFTFSGYIDSYYFENTNNPKGMTNLGQAGNERAFDQRSGTFGLGLVQTKFGYSNKKSDVVVDLSFGPNADLGNYGNSPFLSWNPGNVGAPGTTARGQGTFIGSIAIKQAYFNYKATDKLTFTAGQFGTHIGYEVIDAPTNYNYSLSNLFNNGPFYHIGVKANYAFSEKFSLMAGLVNNVDALYDNNHNKGFIAQTFFNPVKGWNVYFNYIGSNESNPDSLGKAKNGNLYQLFDLTTGYQLTDKFYVGLNTAYGMQKGDYQGNLNPAQTILKVNGVSSDSTKTWGGIALYSNYAFTDKIGFGVRAEYFDNTSGVRGLTNFAAASSSLKTNASYIAGSNKYGGTSVTSLTFTGNFTLAEGHLIVKPEIRTDIYEKKAFSGLDANNIQQFKDSKGNFTQNTQTTIGAAVIYKF
jgi:hypothetical protein